VPWPGQCPAQPAASRRREGPAQVLDLFAFHDLDAAVAGGEGVANLGDPGGGHQALRGVLVFHHDGERAHCLDADGAAVPLGLDDAEPAEGRVFVDGDGVGSVVFGCLCVPRLHAHCLEQLPDQVLELGGRHAEQVGPAVEARDDVHALDELVLRQEGLEVHDGPDSLEIAGVG